MIEDCAHCAYRDDDPRDDPCLSCIAAIYRGEGRALFKPIEEDAE